MTAVFLQQLLSIESFVKPKSMNFFGGHIGNHNSGMGNAKSAHIIYIYISGGNNLYICICICICNIQQAPKYNYSQTLGPTKKHNIVTVVVYICTFITMLMALLAIHVLTNAHSFGFLIIITSCTSLQRNLCFLVVLPWPFTFIPYCSEQG